ncbi:unnamed protein product [Citrullus colocynthis]|uniref:Uncharacterized protein n=1 Tax=Citrullus colocynthis TaxID=252529 RepID=A0ABP0YAR8_9ROSI
MLNLAGTWQLWLSGGSYKYLYLRWGKDLTKVVVFVGESGDTDYERLIGGVHKTVILKRIGCNVSKLHADRSYPMEHVVPFSSPKVVQAEGCKIAYVGTASGSLVFLRPRKLSSDSTIAYLMSVKHLHRNCIGKLGVLEA